MLKYFVDVVVKLSWVGMYGTTENSTRCARTTSRNHVHPRMVMCRAKSKCTSSQKYFWQKTLLCSGQKPQCTQTRPVSPPTISCSTRTPNPTIRTVLTNYCSHAACGVVAFSCCTDSVNRHRGRSYLSLLFVSYTLYTPVTSNL